MANLLSYGHRNGLLSVYDELRSVYAISDAQIGLLASVFMGAHAIATIPFGLIGDRCQRSRVLSLAVLAWSVAGIFCVFATTYFQLVCARIVVGVATAAIVPVTNASLAASFPQEKARVIAMLNLGLLFGGAAGVGLGGLFGLEVTLLTLSLPGLMLAVFLWFVPSPSVEMPLRSRTNNGATNLFHRLGPAVKQSTKQIVKVWNNPALGWLVVSAVCMAFATGGLSNWFVDFLEHEKGLSREHSLVTFLVCFLGGVIGVAFGAWRADTAFVNNPLGRAHTMIGGMLAAFPLLVGCVYLEVSGPFFLISFGGMFFLSWYHAPLAASVDDVVSDNAKATSQSVVVFCMHLFGTAPSVWCVGLLRQRYGFSGAMLVPIAGVFFAALALLLGRKAITDNIALQTEARSSRPPSWQ